MLDSGGSQGLLFGRVISSPVHPACHDEKGGALESGRATMIVQSNSTGVEDENYSVDVES